MEQRFGENRIEMDSKPDEKTAAAIGLPFPCYCLMEQIKEPARDLFNPRAKKASPLHFRRRRLCINRTGGLCPCVNKRRLSEL